MKYSREYLFDICHLAEVDELVARLRQHVIYLRMGLLDIHMLISYVMIISLSI